VVKVYSDRIKVSIDIGTTKICVIIAQQLDAHRIEVLGMGKAPSHGLKKGVVVDIGKTIHSIKRAVQEAELMAGVKVESAYIGISGAHIHSLNSQGITPIKHGDVRQADIDSVLASAQAIPVPEGQQILHVLPQYFLIDGHEKVQDPFGMHGIRLEVEAHIILGAVSSVQNLVKCCESAGIKVADIVLEQLASAEAVLSDDERELGIGVLDIGGGTSDLALYQHGSIRHTMVLAVAGNHFTNDVAIGLRTTIDDAERVKREYGLASIKFLDQDVAIDVEMVHGNARQSVQRSALINIIEPRTRELLSLVHEELISRKLLSYVPAGMVITGGGSLLKGIKEVAEEIFNMPVRIGMPRIDYDLPESLNNPIYATGYGLLMHALKKEKHNNVHAVGGPLLQRISERMKSWVADFF
jgi:cell division protein FtsA